MHNNEYAVLSSVENANDETIIIPHEQVRETFEWGSITGEDKQLHHIKLKDMSDENIKEVLHEMHDWLEMDKLQALENELSFRAGL